MNVKPNGVLALEDGRQFSGFLFGAELSADEILSQTHRDKGYGEAVFNTSMTGYQEILSDPSYYGQIVCMTTPHIGNTGINDEDNESKHPWAAGFIVHDWHEEPSNWRSSQSLQSYLKEYHIPGLHGIETRALTRHLRQKGVIRSVILPVEEADRATELLRKLPDFEGRDLLHEVTTPEPYQWSSTGKYKVVVLDFGVKWNLLRCLADRGCQVEVVPAQTSPEDILALKPDGVFLSNGPGDPSAAPYAVQTVKSLLGKVPLFGVCMGHQVLSLALGAKTYKLKFGHRGGNQPVLDSKTRRVEISSHNHGYTVDKDSLPEGVEVSHMNLNDLTVEGIDAPAMNAFSVQHHPEACPGPHDSALMFDRFIDQLEKRASL